MNDQGAPAGTFGFDQKTGNASIGLFDKAGKVIWSAGKPNLAPLSSELRPETLVHSLCGGDLYYFRAVLYLRKPHKRQGGHRGMMKHPELWSRI